MIVRTPKRDRFLIISKIPLEDKRLSWKARGLHAYLMSKPDAWSVVVAHLVSQSERDGREAVLTGLRELEAAGYIRRTARHGQRGKFDGTDYEVFEEPTANGFPAHGQSAASEEGPVVNDELEKKEAQIAVSESVDLEAVKRRNREIMPALALMGPPRAHRS